MGAALKTWNTIQLPDNIAAHTIATPVSFALNKISIGIHEALGLETYEPINGYDKNTFSIIQGVKDSYNKTFLPFANENAANDTIYWVVKKAA